jgi:hypothetical protein
MIERSKSSYHSRSSVAWALPFSLHYKGLFPLQGYCSPCGLRPHHISWAVKRSNGPMYLDFKDMSSWTHGDSVSFVPPAPPFLRLRRPSSSAFGHRPIAHGGARKRCSATLTRSWTSTVRYKFPHLHVLLFRSDLEYSWPNERCPSHSDADRGASAEIWELGSSRTREGEADRRSLCGRSRRSLGPPRSIETSPLESMEVRLCFVVLSSSCSCIYTLFTWCSFHSLHIPSALPLEPMLIG